ncbi:hypothetical protein [Stella sp.]|uniref:hypothetical protein n=1 Tax=Stella sp. TaxID=2912054 RepID=UPI0035B3A168
MRRARSTRDARSVAASIARSQKNAAQSARLATASATVIGRRLALAQAALHDPLTADHGEFARMVAEKGFAAFDAGLAALGRQPSLAVLGARFWAVEIGAAVEAGRRIASARSPAEAVQAQWRWAGESAARAWSLSLGIGRALAETTGAMTAPVLRVAAANARRLG